MEHKRSRLKEKNTFSSFTNVTGKQTNPLYRSPPAEKIELTCIYYLSSSSVFLLNNQNSLNSFCEGMMSLFLKALQTLPAFDFWVFKLVRLKRWFDKPSKDVLNGKVEWCAVCLRLTVTACWPCCITVEVGTEKGQTINKLKKKKFQITFVETADFFYSQKKLIIPKESFTKHKLSHHISTVHPERSIYSYYSGHKKT